MSDLPTHPIRDDDDNDQSMDDPARGRVRDALSSSLPTDVGPYHILELISEGGMGSVYRAQQRGAVTRIVALKLIKLGMDTREVIARFEGERQALAMMEHPNIAKVFDAGATDAGRPYFVMEYVPGLPITTYCDKHNLSIPARLKLFAQVCDAVQHAHQKGIIHRDIKPGNVLVASYDDRPVPKVIDFGVAKATRHRLTERTLFTERGAMIGTPAYMSPEQAEMSMLDVDTRSDVYSLGVLLYELLTGALPFDPKSLRQAAYAEIQRIICEVDPPRPSTRLSSLDAAVAGDIAARRQSAVEALRTQLRGELEWIPLKAMRKDRTERYRTASELSDDVANYLASRPLMAGPESAVYRARKFARRNKGPIAAAAAIVLVLILGVIGTTIGLIGQARQRARAEQQRAEAETSRANEAAVNEFLTRDLLGAVDPAVSRGKDLTVKDALDRAAKTIDKKLAGHPRVAAAVRGALADGYRALGQYAIALPHAQAALSTLRASAGDDQPETIAAIARCAVILHELSRLADAEPLYREAIDRAKRVLGADHPQTLAPMGGLASLTQDLGRLEEAETQSRDVLSRYRKGHGNDDQGTLQAMLNLASILHARGNLAETASLQREALDGALQTLGDDHPLTLTVRTALGSTLRDQGDLAGAEEQFREATEVRRRVLGPDHPDTLSTYHNVALLRASQGDLEGAEAIGRDLLERCRRSLPEDNPQTITVSSNLASVLAQRGKLDEAEPLARESVERATRAFGADHPSTLSTANTLARMLYARRKLPEAEALYRQVVDGRRRTLGPSHPDTLIALFNLVTVLVDQRKLEEAVEPAAELYRLAFDARDTMEPARSATCMARYGAILAKLGRYGEAEAPLRATIERLGAAGQTNGPAMRDMLAALADTCDHLGHSDEAKTLREQLAHLPPMPGGGRPATTGAANTRPSSLPATQPGR